jgi:hypothetical protein
MTTFDDLRPGLERIRQAVLSIVPSSYPDRTGHEVCMDEEEFEAVVTTTADLPAQLGRLAGRALLALIAHSSYCGWPTDSDARAYWTNFLGALAESRAVDPDRGEEEVRVVKRPGVLSTIKLARTPWPRRRAPSRQS